MAPTKGPIAYRRFVEGDIAAVERLLCRRMWAETAYASLDYSSEKVCDFLRGFCFGDDTFGCVALCDGEPVGMFMGRVTSYFFGDDLLAFEDLWYVAREHRSSAIGPRLLREFQNWARCRNVREICVGVSSGTDADRVGRLLERKGYRHMGGIYKLPVVDFG